MSGSATFTIVASRTIINTAVVSTKSAAQRFFCCVAVICPCPPSAVICCLLTQTDRHAETHRLSTHCDTPHAGVHRPEQRPLELLVLQLERVEARRLKQAASVLARVAALEDPAPWTADRALR